MTKKKEPATPKEVATLDKNKRAFFKPCKTRDELKAWIKYFIGLEIPDVKVSRYASTTPLDMIWEIYRITVLDDNPEKIGELLYTASRGAGKSLGAAIAEFMVMVHDKRDVAHVGAIMNQAKRTYDYQLGFYNSRKIKPLLDPFFEKSTMEKSSFVIDDTNRCIEVVPCTMKALNGIHASVVCTDEIDTVSGEGLTAFKEISGMLDTKHGRTALRIGISTRKSTFGLMNRMIENAEKEQRHLRFWTILEFTERCPDSRSGTATETFYVNQDKGEVINYKDYSMKTEEKQKEYQPYVMFEKCIACPIAPFCLGDAKNQTCKSPMLKKIHEPSKKTLESGVDWASAQLFNLKPSTEGIIFKEFEEKAHVLKWNQMWKILVGKEYPGVCTHDIFIKKCNELEVPCYSGQDFGWSSPSTTVYLYIDKRDNIFIVRAEGATFVNDPTWVHYIKTKFHNMYRCQLYFPDIANGSAVDIMRNEGLPVSDKIDKSINLGIQTIKKFLRIPGQNIPKLFIAEETCKPLINELKMYHNKMDAGGDLIDEPEDEFNHYIDPLRYILTYFFGHGQVTLAAGSGIEENEININGVYSKIPSAEQFAIQNNININTDIPEDFKPKTGKLSELDNDKDNDTDIGGNGGFLWSF